MPFTTVFSRPSHLGVIPTICSVRAKSWFFEKSLQICKVLKINRDKVVWKNVARVFIRLSLLLLAKTFLVARSKEKRLYSQARKNGKKSRVFLFFQSYKKCLISDFFSYSQIPFISSVVKRFNHRIRSFITLLHPHCIPYVCSAS